MFFNDSRLSALVVALKHANQGMITDTINIFMHGLACCFLMKYEYSRFFHKYVSVYFVVTAQCQMLF